MPDHQLTDTNSENKFTYSTSNLVTARIFILALSPIWLFWSAAALFGLFQLLPTLPGADLWQFFVFGLFYLGLIATGLLALRVCADTNLSLSREGVRFPSRFLFESKGKLSRPWADLRTVDLRDEDGQAAIPRTISLIYEDGACLPLSIAGLGRDALKQLILSISMLAPGARFVPELGKVDLQLPAGPLTAEGAGLHASYTQLWEEELANRFGSTIFVPLTAGEKLQGGKIKIEGQLSFGGLSAVYLARMADLNKAGESSPHNSSGKTIVVKEAVLPVGTQDELAAKASEMFEREAGLLSKIEHPCIASVLDYFQENGRHYIVLSHIEGVDLRRFVRQHGRQNSDCVWRWLKELAQLLVYLHGLTPPIVHRDLTPDNIVLGSDGRLKLIDFGAASNFVGTATGTLVGKQAYISPEQFRGKASLSSDLYSLGGTMAFALTGEDPEALMQTTAAALPIGTDKELARLIFALTSQETSERPQSAQALLSEVEALARR